MLLLSVPVPLAAVGTAGGGSALIEPGADGGASATAGQGGSGASSGTVGKGGSGTGGSYAGGGAGGSYAGGGAGGSYAGGGAGGSYAGAGGGSCRNPNPLGCSTETFAIPKSCIDPSLANVGTPLPAATCNEICNASYVFNCSVQTVAASSVTVQCNSGCAVGRRPDGLCAESSFDTASLGGYFAEIARLEAAAVTAFRVMRDELRAHGAPKRLVRGAARAARDEVRHARATGALARRFGAEPKAPVVERGALRSLEAMALENAVEGCVRETYGALIATRQAAHAQDPDVRAALRRIARDETRHASLSWQVGRWLETRLDRAAKRKVEHAKALAARELLSAIEREPRPAFADMAGLPEPTEALELGHEMRRRLWS
jgi:hypothetical protein